MSQLSKTNEYDGDAIHRTKQCPDCPYRLEVLDDGDAENRVIDICFWGVAWKIFSKESKILKTCSKLKKQRPQFNVQWRQELKMKFTS